MCALCWQEATCSRRSGEVQDVYSLRCAPAVHGAEPRRHLLRPPGRRDRDERRHRQPALLPRATTARDHATEPWDFEFRANWEGTGYSGEGRASYSAGNFHGQPVGFAADYLACAVAEIADVSERRTSMLLDANYNRGLPPNLVAKPGVNSGFMLAQYTSAALVSENKVSGPPFVGRLDPDFGQLRGPRGDVDHGGAASSARCSRTARRWWRSSC